MLAEGGLASWMVAYIFLEIMMWADIDYVPVTPETAQFDVHGVWGDEGGKYRDYPCMCINIVDEGTEGRNHALGAGPHGPYRHGLE
jgi:hypothetical protein